MPPLLPSPGKTGSPDRRPSDHESDDYVAQMRRFLVPEVDTPESSAPYSLCRLESMDRAQSAMFADAPPLECEPEPKYTEDTNTAADPKNTEPEERTTHGQRAQGRAEGDRDGDVVRNQSTAKIVYSSQDGLRADVSSHGSLNDGSTRVPVTGVMLSDCQASGDQILVPKEVLDAQDSVSTAVTAAVDHLLDMPLTDSASSPLLVPGTHHQKPQAADGSSTRTNPSGEASKSRIPSTIKRSLARQRMDCHTREVTTRSFSFPKDAPEDALTPKNFETHDMWDMRQVTFAVPTLQLSQGSGNRVIDHDATLSHEVMDCSGANTGMLVASDGPSEGLPISSLTPVAANNNLYTSPANNFSGASTEDKDSALSQYISRPPVPGASKSGQGMSRIPSYRSGTKIGMQGSGLSSATESTPTPATDEAIIWKPKNLSSPSVAPAGQQPAVQTDGDAASVIETPSYSRLLAHIDKQSHKPVHDQPVQPSPAYCVPYIVQPGIPPDVNVTTSSDNHSLDNPGFKQLVQNIQAHRYQSPAVNFAVMTYDSSAKASPSTSSDNHETHDQDDSVTQSEMGENFGHGDHLPQTGFAEDAKLAVEHSSDDVCCSRISGSTCDENNDVREDHRSIGCAQQVKHQDCRAESPSVICEEWAGAVNKVAWPLKAVQVSLFSAGDGTSQVKVALDVCQAATSSSGGTPDLKHEVQRCDGFEPQVVGACALEEEPTSCSVYIGSATPASQNDAVTASCMPLQDQKIVSASGFVSPTHVVPSASISEAVSPPNLCRSPCSGVQGQTGQASSMGNAVHSPIKSLSPEHSVMTPDFPRGQSPVVAHIEVMKQMLRSGHLSRPRDAQGSETGICTNGTPTCGGATSHVENIGTGTGSDSPVHTPGSGAFQGWLEDHNIHSAVKHDHVTYSVVGDLWKCKEVIHKEFEGFKKWELEHAAATEQEHAHEMKRLMKENEDMLARAVKAEEQSYLLSEELSAVKRELAVAQESLRKIDLASHTTGADQTNFLPLDAPSGGSAGQTHDSLEERIEFVIDEVKGLEETISSVCKRSGTQNTSRADFIQIYSYFHHLKARTNSGRMQLTERTESSIDKVMAFVKWAKPSIAELCTCYDTTAKEVTRRSVEIARLHEMGDFGDDSLMQQQTENDDLSHHLDGVSVSMRWHLFEVFNRLHKMGQDWMIAVKSDHNGVHDDANLEGNSAPYALDRSSAGQNHRDFEEPLSLMLGRRAKAIQGQLESMSLTSYQRSHQAEVHIEESPVRVISMAATPEVGTGNTVSMSMTGDLTPFQSLWIESPPQPDPEVSDSMVADTCRPQIRLLGPVLDKENPLYNCSPEAACGSSSDAPTSFAPPESSATPLSSGGSSSQVVEDSQEELLLPLEMEGSATGQDENVQQTRTRKSSETPVHYPTKDRIHFICHALNMGSSPFVRYNERP